MYDIANDSSLNEDDSDIEDDSEGEDSSDSEDDSDEECQILEEKWLNPPTADYPPSAPDVASCVRASVISVSAVVGFKRPADDSQINPREATGFKLPALQIAAPDDEHEWPTSESSPVPTTSQSLVQSSITTPEHQSMLGHSNQPQMPGCSVYPSRPYPMQQPTRSVLSLPFPPQCAHSSSSVPNSHFQMCCNSLARPIPMRPSGLIPSHYSPQPSCNSGESSGSYALDTNTLQPSVPLQQRHDCSPPASHSMNSPFQSCASSQSSASSNVHQFIRTQCVQCPAPPNSHLVTSSSCTAPNNRASPPQRAFEQPQTSSQFNHISSIPHPSPENNGPIASSGPIHPGQAALDLSSPPIQPPGRSPRSSPPAVEQHPIWQGTLHYEEKAVNLNDPNVSHYLSCTFSALLNTNGDFYLGANMWPSQMALSLIASEILKEKNMFEVLKRAAHHVVITFHEESQVLKRIKRNMNHGWMGCIQFVASSDVRILIVLYMPQKKVYVGFIPHEQKVFFNTFRHVYEKRRRIRNLQKQVQQMEASVSFASSQPTSSLDSTSRALSEVLQSRNQFEEIDNEIDAHILALRRRHQESQPSTSYQQQQPSTSSQSASNHSIEERLQRLESAQKGSTRNVNEYEEIDNEINAQIAAHWVRHFSEEGSASTSQQRQNSPQMPSMPFSSSHASTERMKRSPYPMIWPFVPPECVMYYSGRSPGTITVEVGTHTATINSQTSQNTIPAVDNNNSVEAQASEIFGKDLVDKIVQKHLRETHKRFYTVEELCDEILKYEESKPKPVEEKEKKEVPEELLCKICLDERLSIVFEPCGHLATCQECAKPLAKCPMCRTIVRKKMRIYM